MKLNRTDLTEKFVLLEQEGNGRDGLSCYNSEIWKTGDLRPAKKRDLEDFVASFPEQRNVAATGDYTDTPISWSWCSEDTEITERYWAGPLFLRILAIKK